MVASAQRPPRLRSGDAVSVVAPSGPVARDRFDAGVAALAGRYDLRFDPDILFAGTGFLAGADDQRLAALHAAFADPETSAVFMARGGYGLLRLLPHLDLDLLRAHPKAVVGFSDGTALLAACARAGVATIHGPVLTQLGSLPVDDRDALVRLLEDPTPGVLLSGLQDVVPGRVSGPLVGGNLEVFSRLLGTPFLPAIDDAILFIEDTGERPYRIDRLITHLDSAGVFSRVVGVVVGDFSRCEEPAGGMAGSPSAQEVLEERLSRLAIPVVLGGTFGHGDRNTPLPYGVMCEVDTRYGILHALQGAVT